MDESGLGALLAMGMGFMLVFFAILIAFYVLKSIGLMTLATNKGIENAWLAWIPIADLYIMGSIVEEMDLFGYRLTNLGMWLPVACIGGMVLGMIPILGFLVSLALMVFMIMFTYNLFKMYTESAVLYTVLSLLLGLFSIFIFIIRNNQPINQGGYTPPTQY
ncbi:MAG: hypothetical protein ABRQ26_03750 [Syntrophomonadaceae bacterium]